MRAWRWYSKLLLALFLATFAYYVWPTPWQVYPIRYGCWQRVNRFTGKVEVLLPQERWSDHLYPPPLATADPDAP